MKYALQTPPSGDEREPIITDGRYTTIKEAEEAAKYICSNHKDLDWKTVYKVVEVED